MNEKEERAMTTISGWLKHERLNAEKSATSALVYSSLRKLERPINYSVLSSFMQLDRSEMHNSR
jgi:hypothetical protein